MFPTLHNSLLGRDQGVGHVLGAHSTVQCSLLLPASLLACSCQFGGEAEGADLAEEAKEKLALWPLPLPPPSSSLLVRP